MKKETQIVKEILNYLSTVKDSVFWRQNTGALVSDKRFIRFGLPGQADITGLFQGKRCEIEVKSKTGKQSENQIKFQKIIEDNGGVYILARSVQDVIDAGIV